AAELSVPMVSKDALKEQLADAYPAVPVASFGPIAMETTWRLVGEMPGTVILDAWLFRPRDLGFVKAGLERCCATMVVEIWCDLPPELARRRYEARVRHAVHRDARRMAESWAEWSALAGPLDVGLTLRVRTDRAVDVAGLAASVQAMAGGNDS
ncbi:MAG: hypothetical protein ABW022_01765, partial [Actinoplanes sp.]